MPWIIVNVLEGHSAEKKRKLHGAVAKAVCDSLDIPPDWVNIQIVEMKREDLSNGGVAMDKL